MYVHKINTVLAVLFTVVVNSCGIQQSDTAVLSKRTQSIIDYFLDETENQYTDENLLELYGSISEDSNYIIGIYAVDSSFSKPYGKYNGRVRYKKYDILLFGDSWNDFFWSSDTTYIVENMNSDEQNYVFYDPISWEICLSLKDTTINIDCSNFPDIFSEHTISLIDSIEIILRH